MCLRAQQRAHTFMLHTAAPYPCSPAARSEQERLRGAARLLLKVQGALAAVALAVYGQPTR